jgi:hypothetical protein
MRSVLTIAAICVTLSTAFGSSAFAEKRVALVIGNSDYRNAETLKNPANDAEDIAAALTRVGFTVLLERNLGKQGMSDAIVRFARLAQDADSAVFFYAGHGLQFRGQNYLMPVDAKLEDEFNLQFELTRMDDIFFGLERTRGLKLVVLDACRENPLAKKLAKIDPMMSRGLARMEPVRGMAVAFSTQANSTAADGEGRNSPFTASLIKRLSEPGLEIATLFRRVAADVDRETKGQQLPELSLALVGEYYFNGSQGETPQVASRAPVEEPPAPQPIAPRADLVLSSHAQLNRNCSRAGIPIVKISGSLSGGAGIVFNAPYDTSRAPPNSFIARCRSSLGATIPGTRIVYRANPDFLGTERVTYSVTVRAGARDSFVIDLTATVRCDPLGCRIADKTSARRD